MDISECRVKLHSPRVYPNGAMDDRCLAFVSVTLDDAFVVRDLRIIKAPDGHLFVSMPSREIEDHCWKCSRRVAIQDRYCRSCGILLGENRAALGADGKAKLYADIAHPITTEFREYLTGHVLDAYHEAYWDEHGLDEPAEASPLTAPLAARVRTGDAA